MNFILYNFPKAGRKRSLSSRLTQSDSARVHRLFGMTAKKRRSAPEWTPLTCQWIEGEPRDRNFCEGAVRSGSSYCEAHHARCYVAAELTDEGK